MRFEEAVEQGLDVTGDVLVCGVDSDRTRCNVASFCLTSKAPCVVTAVGMNADKGHVFVQESRPETACFVCAFPGAHMSDEVISCAIGSTIDILLVMAGIVTYSIASIFMDRSRAWNYKLVCLSDASAERTESLAWNQHCPLCTSKEST